MSFPYRNAMKKNKNFKLDYNVKYSAGEFKPHGFWYQFRNCLQDWGELSWGNICIL